MTTIELSEQTQAMIESAMVRYGFTDADRFVRALLRTLEFDWGGGLIDVGIMAAIAEADRQTAIPWEQAKAELMERFDMIPRVRF